jgi:hypothetical protein
MALIAYTETLMVTDANWIELDRLQSDFGLIPI